ncbi:hypothetical protein LCM20_17975 [Halobacillus litoralis]|uniref:hypothetical protein n=1 Tax=Halobacillus litoralis TaxID=45668 RepID=UPI001CD41F0D|nr:hypothetical protein [Halobacillus litoralis]MCA0972488.1 hypothetical protein [Halobacillus litoralis]
MNVQFDSINVNSIHMNSGVFVGSNSQDGWSASMKENSALGTVVGTGNVIHHNVNVIHDEDMIDTPIMTEQKTGGKGQAST